MIAQKCSHLQPNNINMPFKSKDQRKFMYAKHPKIAKRWSKHTPKGKKLPEKVNEESFDSLVNEYMKMYLFENYPAMSQSNSGQVDPARMSTNNVDPTAGMPVVNPQGGNPQAFQKVKPNKVQQPQAPKIDPNFYNQLKAAHDPNNPNQQQTDQVVSQLMSQPNAPMIDQNSEDFKALPVEIQNSLKTHTNQVANQNNYANNVATNNVKAPAKPQNKAPQQYTANYMPPQQAQRPPQAQGSVGGVV